jgi:hypothetical protein
MEWFEKTPSLAKLALSVGGASVAALATLLPHGVQPIALCWGLALCLYGIGATVSQIRKSTKPTWHDALRRKEFERQQAALLNTFQRTKPRIAADERFADGD